MSLASRTLAAALLSLPGWAFAGDQASAAPALGDLRKVGKVQLPASCGKAVQPDFDSAVALLHSFFYEEARRRFVAVAEKAPDCAMAQWGVAMTWWHPIWAPPTEAEMKAGTDAIEKAAASSAKASPLEKDLIAALQAFYRTPEKAGTAPQGESCHGPTGGSGGHRARTLAYEAAMADVAKRHPKNVEVAAFYALGLLGSADPTDRTLSNQARAAQLLEPHFAAKKDHPGLAHYLIHAYDYPQTAMKGLPAARLYADIAPWVPHVLHMPSHIFTRLGMWSEVASSNLASADAARSYQAKWHADATSFEELHALDYLLYAYLQSAQDQKAKALVDQVALVKKTYPEADMVVAYALGAIPARYALERREWKEAAELVIPKTTAFPKFPFGEAHIEFAKAIGAARSGKPDVARQSIARLQALKGEIKDERFAYFARQLDMQKTLAEGFLANAQGKGDEAIKLVRQAADTDDALGKHPVSPGSMYPARELLADLLLEKGAAKEALAEYEAALKLNPRRFTGLFGAGRAAEQAGQPALARKYYGELVDLARTGDGTRRDLIAAKAYLDKTKM
jgi:tetratricopeptide (TPR) repeat protein